MHFVLFKTPMGDIKIELFTSHAPKTCANFLAYLEAGYYRQSSFFRIVLPHHPQSASACKIAVAQGGPKFDLTGHDPARMKFHLDHEPTSETGLRHTHGTLSMGRFAKGQTYGGFFLCYGDQPELNAGGKRFPDHAGAAAFGQIAHGWDVFEELMQCGEESEFLENEIPLSVELISSKLGT